MVVASQIKEVEVPSIKLGKEFNINDYINEPVLEDSNFMFKDEVNEDLLLTDFEGLTDGLTESGFTEVLTEFLTESELTETNYNSNPNLNYGTNTSNLNISRKVKKPKKRKKRSRLSKVTNLSPSIFKQQRNKLMMIIIKYISMKITNLFPPNFKENKLSLEKFLIIIINRLKLSVNSFLKSVIYLLRYMDIIYLLRYLNQSNNFANFNEMDFPLKELIIGCIKLTLMQEKIHKNWSNLVGLSNNQINLIIKKILDKLNNKLIIKDDEFCKFKLEIFRYVKMISS
ncbi:hypothetical protein CLIB1444_01S08526 [[Candida] jaroonii]|uniref:Uncharacterized protein n=1 Tax=[Candida] jaroonii TaxID=467808 RepID=A0ACA9Y0Q5_9ASCO|nr:hypothetical protein CLIB1444_01S08526 [[Candida] jaroonii]